MNRRTSSALSTTSTPKTFTSPEVGKIRVEMIRSAVVFPAPFGPISPKISPDLTVKLRQSRARMFPNTLTTDLASTATLNSPTPARVKRSLLIKACPSCKAHLLGSAFAHKLQNGGSGEVSPNDWSLAKHVRQSHPRAKIEQSAEISSILALWLPIFRSRRRCQVSPQDCTISSSCQSVPSFSIRRI